MYNFFTSEKLNPKKMEDVNTAWALDFTKTLKDLGYIDIRMLTNTFLINNADEALIPV